MIRFIFDLDGTVTTQETLPLIANHFGIQDEIHKITIETIQGNIPFIESFIKRVHILGKLPVDEIDLLLEQVMLYEKVSRFIQKNIDRCVIATGNLDCWTKKLAAKVGCEYFHSTGVIKNNNVVKLKSILRKESIVDFYKAQGYFTVFIGEGNNDMEAMRLSDVSIASGLTHQPANSVLSIANYLVYSEESLCRLLNQLL